MAYMMIKRCDKIVNVSTITAKGYFSSFDFSSFIRRIRESRKRSKSSKSSSHQYRACVTLSLTWHSASFFLSHDSISDSVLVAFYNCNMYSDCRTVYSWVILMLSPIKLYIIYCYFSSLFTSWILLKANFFRFSLLFQIRRIPWYSIWDWALRMIERYVCFPQIIK